MSPCHEARAAPMGLKEDLEMKNQVQYSARYLIYGLVLSLLLSFGGQRSGGDGVLEVLATASPMSLQGSSAVPAFPGAEGYGSKTPGGRGGTVIEVTNLNDTGPGSLRAALEASGPRIVVFRTGGTIKLATDIVVLNPLVTVAGQTAPGDGITVRGAAISLGTHDVILRNLRVRVGDDPNGPEAGNRDGIRTDGSSNKLAYNIIIDHCSVS